MSLTTAQDRRRKRMMLEQGNPELGISDPGAKRQSKALGSPPVDLNIAKPVTRKKENDSENKSKENTDSLTAFASWVDGGNNTSFC